VDKGDEDEQLVDAEESEGTAEGGGESESGSVRDSLDTLAGDDILFWRNNDDTPNQLWVLCCVPMSSNCAILSDVLAPSLHLVVPLWFMLWLLALVLVLVLV
jgi:hypothetical protein